MRMTLQDWALLFLLSILWGGSFFFVAIAIRDLPPLTVVVLRTGIAALALGAILRMRGEAWPLAGGATGAFLVMGLLNNMIPFSLLFWAQTTIPSGLASILNATTPIFSIVVAHFLLADERMAPNKATGILFGFLGVVVLLRGNVVTGAGIASLGMLACLGAALSYGFASVFGRRFKAMRLSATQVAFGQLVATTAMMLPIVAVTDRPWTLPPPGLPVIAAVLALAIVSTALAYVIFFRILASAGAVNTALVTLLVPVSAILLGTLVLGEELAPRHYAGMGLIAIGLLAIDGRLSGRSRKKRKPL
ncbi:Threonine/homoserine efflux transporter RhtA [Lutimaribacter pacificus]|uniref:Threonine/homoserine efflux transporter RhtA n=1 Tax=Lutimaribacter pacificus TaxID=391948 RepID=A0A1H0GUD2_9RHOB|nr:DMT family transporter [Lutimaribacter pacificus]SDO10485.1 Threonine/homoserine efflux transporter RhtA [Lutimaribacter pacificus]SHJ91996.1 Threonine/homoserine efflux transporter RhtA [Lutimaribacter pacificus]